MTSVLETCHHVIFPSTGLFARGLPARGRARLHQKQTEEVAGELHYFCFLIE